METLESVVDFGEVVSRRPISRRDVNRRLLKSAFSLAALGAALKTGESFARKIDGPILDQPRDPADIPQVIPPRQILAVVEMVNGQARWVIKGSGFSDGRIGLNALNPKSEEVHSLLNPYVTLFGPSFSFVTALRPAKGQRANHVFQITALDIGLGLSSNAVEVATL